MQDNILQCCLCVFPYVFNKFYIVCIDDREVGGICAFFLFVYCIALVLDIVVLVEVMFVLFVVVCTCCYCREVPFCAHPLFI